MRYIIHQSVVFEKNNTSLVLSAMGDLLQEMTGDGEATAYIHDRRALACFGFEHAHG